MEFVWQDVRHGARALLKSPGVTLVVVLTLALGIGGNTAIFSVVNFVLLRPLTYSHPDQLVMIWERNLRKGFSASPTSFGNFVDFRDTSKSVDIAAFTETNFNLTGGDQPERVAALQVSANLFSILGVNPIRGRIFSLSEDTPGSGRVVIISHGLWQRSFGSNPGLVNQTLQLNSQNYTVIGVMPKDFKFPPAFSAALAGSEETILNADLWVPLTTDDVPLVRDLRNLKMIGRLKPGVTLPQAQAEINGIASRLEKEYPNVNSGMESHLMLLSEQVTGDVRKALFILLAAVALVLLIACANVANLLLAKATSRQKEIAIRTALGATRIRLVRQLLTENVLLGLLGGLVGLLFAFVGTRGLMTLVSPTIPRLKDFTFDVKVLLFTLVISLLTSLIFGLAPALDASRPNLNQVLKEGGRGSGVGSSRRHLRNLLVIAEIALAVVLVSASGLMLRSFVRMQSVNPGFNPKNLITLEIDLPEGRYHAVQQQTTFQQQLLQRIISLPGVQDAGTVDYLPFSGSALNSSFMIEGRPIPALTERPRAFYRVIGSNYFEAMGIPLRQGRRFTDYDTADAPGVAIISDAAARKYWPGEDPVGKRVKRGRPESKNPWLSVVGTVGSASQNSLRDESYPEIYVPYLQNTSRTLTLVLRTTSDPKKLTGAVREELWAMDKELPVTNMKLMEELVGNSVAQPRLYVLLISVFAALALILTAVGVYGVVAYSVTQQTHDIGIRMALGARPIDVFKHVLGQTLILALIGLGIGLAMAVGATRLISSLLYGEKTIDLIIPVVTSLMLLAVALLASYIPARKAARIDPLVALRYE